MTYDWRKFEPFRFWCHKVLPLVYDDSLSYYEMLCKLYALVSKLIELCNELIDAVKELNGRVTVLEQTVDLLNQELVKLKTRMDNAEHKIESLEDTVTNIQTSITNILSTLAEYGDRITQVEGDITQINSTLLEISNSISNITKRVETLEQNVTNLQENPYVLPVASASRLGGIKVGNNLTIRPDGTLDAQAGGGDSEVKTFRFGVPCKVYDDEGHTNDPLFTRDANVMVYVKGNQIVVNALGVYLVYNEALEATPQDTYRDMFFADDLSKCTDKSDTFEGARPLNELIELLASDKILGNELITPEVVNDKDVVYDNVIDINAIGHLSLSTVGTDAPTIFFEFKGVIPQGNSGISTNFSGVGFLAKGGTGGSSGNKYIVNSGEYQTTPKFVDNETVLNPTKVYYNLYNDDTIEMWCQINWLSNFTGSEKTKNGLYVPINGEKITVELPYTVYGSGTYNSCVVNATCDNGVYLSSSVDLITLAQPSYLRISPLGFINNFQTECKACVHIISKLNKV